MARSFPHRHRGFTLIEMMLTLAIAALVLALGVPNIQQFLRDSRTTTQTNDLVSLINLARSQAIHEGHRAQLCISSNEQNCSSGNWSDGWLVWVDRNDNLQLESSEVARVAQGIGNTSSAQSRNSADASFSNITFLPTGFAELGNGIAFAEITLQPRHCSGRQARQITVNASGATRSERSDCTI